MKGYKKYYTKKIIWYVLTLVVAIILNFLLPRLMPGDPVSAIAARAVQGVTDQTAVQAVVENYVKNFGLDKPMHIQFIHYIQNLFKGDFGVSFVYYPRAVSNMLASAIGWTICLQLPAIIVGWFLGNVLGAVAAYIKKGWDKAVLPAFLFLSNMPAFGMAILLQFFFAVYLKWFPASLGYGFDMVPNFSLKFIWSVITHYQLPFWSIVLITIGGQAIGMRSMSIYELNADYVRYSRFLGIKDRKVVRYVFRNAMLPQITGLALSLGTMVGGALVAEMIFSYPGLGTTLLQSVTGRDYPVISACTLIITIMVLIANLALEVIYGFIDPRVKAVQQDV
ncbi:MAG: ABC transporter permease [Bacillota bacterium]|nr:ABC transporter permease [Bacillota bacterium]